MTAFTHNVCALFCKSMVVDVCLLLMYIHYESCFKTFHVSLSELLLLLLDQFHLAKKKKKIGNKMLLSSKKIVKSDLWVKKINKMELNLTVCIFSLHSSIGTTLNFIRMCHFLFVVLILMRNFTGQCGDICSPTRGSFLICKSVEYCNS